MNDIVTTALPTPSTGFERFRTRFGWLVAIAVLLAAMVAWRASQVPVFGGFQIRTIAAGSMAVALLAMAAAVVIIAGGFNFAVGSMLVFVNCFSAWLMQGRDLPACLGIAVLSLLVSTAVSALMGWLSVVSGIPDIVVSLAVSFALPGVALLILGGPGGGTSPAFVDLVVGGFSNPWPSLLWLAATLLVVWLPLRRSRIGKAIYAIGSSRPSAFLSGVNVGRTKIIAYAFSGLFAGLAGLATTAYTASGEPRASIGLSMLLSAVASVVLGGVALSGGTGGLLGPVMAAFVLSLIPAIMLGLGVDPNIAETVRGAILIAVVMVGGWVQLRRNRA